MPDRACHTRDDPAGLTAWSTAAAGTARLAACLAVLLASAAAQAGERDPTASTGPISLLAALPVRPSATAAASRYGDTSARSDPVMLAGRRVDWHEISPAEAGVLHVPGVAAPTRRWRLDGTVGDEHSTKRLEVSGEALAVTTNEGAIVVAYFVPEMNSGRRVRNNTKDSRRGWTLLKQGGPVELGSGHVEPWFSPWSFKYKYTLLQVSLSDGKHVCVTFHGKRTSGGSYSGSVGGYLCAPPGIDLSDSQAASFLKAVTVGFGREEVPSDIASLLRGAHPRTASAEAEQASSDTGPLTAALTKPHPTGPSQLPAVVTATSQPELVPKDEAERVQRIRLAADGGSAKAMTMLGDMYDRGRGVPEDPAQALAYYLRAAQLGNSDAMSNLGRLHETGRGTPKDAALAVGWYERAIAAGNRYAPARLGRLLATGAKGLPADPRRALDLFRLAADRGFLDIHADIGRLFETGQGAPDLAALRAGVSAPDGRAAPR